MNTVKIYKGDDKRVVVEDKDFDKSLFSQQYTRAIELAIQGNDSLQDNTEPRIVAFCGERGTGKSSCMRTTLNIFRNHPQYVKDKCNIDTSFFIIDGIDPSFFDKNHNLLELVLGKMYQEVSKDCDTINDALIDMFNDIKRTVSMVKIGDENIYDAIQALGDLSAALDLKRKMSELMDAFLKSKNKDKLIIAIDDLDFYWTGAYDMLEIIRKYLSSTKCCVFITVSINQLIKLLSLTLKKQTGDDSSVLDFKNIAIKYVNKLIPLSNRVNMPSVHEDLSNFPLEILDSHENEKRLMRYKSVKEAVCKLIFEKTKYLFYNSLGSVSLIVPDNLRSLQQILGLLYRMPSYTKGTKEGEIQHESNKKVFSDYFFNTWTLQLTEEDRVFVNELIKDQDAQNINKTVIGFLYNRMLKGNNEKDDYKAIVNPFNYSYNISVGDVFYILDFLERSRTEREDQLIIFFIKSFYSMRLYEYYDVITASEENLHPVFNDNDDSDSVQIYKNDYSFNHANRLQTFVNGDYFYFPSTKLYKFEDPMDNYNLSFTTFEISSKSLFGSLEKSLNDNFLLKEEHRELQDIASYFILSISRKAIDNMNYRESPEPYYLKEFDDNDVLIFNPLHIFFSVINLQSTFERFGELGKKLYSEEMSDSNSLLFKMMSVSESKKTGFEREKRFVSDAIIRNSEVLSSLIEKINGSNSILIQTTNNASSIANFYGNITNCDMRLYEVDENKKYYNIQFRFLSVIKKFLSKMKNQETFDNILMSLMISNAKTNLTGKLF